MQKVTEWEEITQEQFNSSTDVISSENKDNHQIKYYTEVKE